MIAAADAAGIFAHEAIRLYGAAARISGIALDPVPAFPVVSCCACLCPSVLLKLAGYFDGDLVFFSHEYIKYRMRSLRQMQMSGRISLVYQARGYLVRFLRISREAVANSHFRGSRKWRY